MEKKKVCSAAISAVTGSDTTLSTFPEWVVTLIHLQDWLTSPHTNQKLHLLKYQRPALLNDLYLNHGQIKPDSLSFRCCQGCIWCLLNLSMGIGKGHLSVVRLAVYLPKHLMALVAGHPGAEANSNHGSFLFKGLWQHLVVRCIISLILPYVLWCHWTMMNCEIWYNSEMRKRPFGSINLNTTPQNTTQPGNRSSQHIASAFLLWLTKGSSADWVYFADQSTFLSLIDCLA